MKAMRLNEKHVAIFDDEDLDKLSSFTWHAQESKRSDGTVRTAYAYTVIKDDNGNNKTLLMHRVITGAEVKLCVDHINGNGLDNRKENLRVCTRSQNIKNQKPGSTGTSSFKGVSWSPRHKKWSANIRSDGVSYGLGFYALETDAAQAYDEAAISLHGDFAHTNSNGPYSVDNINSFSGESFDELVSMCDFVGNRSNKPSPTIDMGPITIPGPKTCAEAIRLVCFLRSWTRQELSKNMGLSCAASLSRILRGHYQGSYNLMLRILEHLPKH